jgi:5-dehydro-4-deoxyglucarate dehydratase
MGDRFSYLGGLPTAEVYAAAYKALGTPVYSSAVFNFMPKTGDGLLPCRRRDDHRHQHRLLDEFFLPYLEIRNRKPATRSASSRPARAWSATTAARCAHR